MYPNSISKLINSLKKLPTIGEKTAERLAFSILDLSNEEVKDFSLSLLDVKNKIKKCKECHNLTEEDFCLICSNMERNRKQICVVGEPKDIIAFEKIGTYKGVYHVLEGLISPLDGINPEDINIKSLLDRIKRDNVEEIILALKPSIEGETTALYILKILEGLNIVISKIARGLPIGVDIEYIDTLTLERALEDRRNIS